MGEGSIMINQGGEAVLVTLGNMKPKQVFITEIILDLPSDYPMQVTTVDDLKREQTYWYDNFGVSICGNYQLKPLEQIKNA